MSAPITWQTVRAGSDVAQAAPILGSAGQSINSAFDAFQNILKQREDVANANMQATQEMGKQAFLDKLQTARTPEELAALQSSGALDTSGLGVQARAALRGAEEARLTGLRQGAVATNTYDDMLRARTEQPIVDALKTQISTANTPAEFAAAQAAVAGSNIKDKAPLADLLHTTGRNRLGEQRADFLAPLAQDKAVREDAAGKRAETEAVYQVGETAVDRTNQTLLTAASAARQTAIAPIRAKIEEVSKFFPDIRRNADGTVDLNQLTTADKATLNGYLKQAELGSLDKLGGDTAAAQKFLEDRRRAGLREDQIDKLRPAVASAFNTTPVAPIGTEAAALERNQRIQQANAKMDAAQFAPSTTPGAADEARQAAKEVINGIHPVGSYRNQNWTEAINNWKGVIARDEQGKPILGADGKTPIRVLPGPAEMRRLLGSIDNQYFGFGNNDINNALKAWENDAITQIGAGRSITNGPVEDLRAATREKPAPATSSIVLPAKLKK